MHMSRQVIDGVIVAAVLALAASHLWAQGSAGRKVIHANQAGGVTGSVERGVSGPNGGGAVGARTISTDGQGNAVGGSAQAVKGPGGAMGARAGGWTRSADGTLHHQSGVMLSGAQGTVSSAGSATKGADGGLSGSRTTSAQANSGATYQGETTYQQGSGVTHSGTCTNAAGAVVACPR